MSGIIKELIAALDRLQAAETAYRMEADLCGIGSTEAFKATDDMKQAGYLARQVLARARLLQQTPGA